MKYRRQPLDLRRFLTAEIRPGLIGRKLRAQIEAAVAGGGDLRPVAAAVVRELLASGGMAPHGALRDGDARVPLYRLVGSPRLYDLRPILEGTAGAEAAPLGGAPPEAHNAAAPAAPAGEVRPAPGAADAPAAAPPRPGIDPLPAGSQPSDVPAWAAVAAMRATFRRDWVSFGLESSLDGLLAELRQHLRDPSLHLVLWEPRLGLGLVEGVGWRVARDDDAAVREAAVALRSAAGGPPIGIVRSGRRYLPVWAGEHVVGALGSRAEGDLRLLVEGAGAVSDLLQASQRSQRRVFTDSLTGVQNRGFFDRQLSVELERSRRAGEPLALLFADLDHFKELNDRYGHLAGDKALQHLAALLARHVRRIDAVFRYGGEEFALLLPGTDVREAYNTAERLRLTLHAEQPSVPGAAGLRLTMSVGGAVFPEHAQGERELLRHADEAMYLAKARGRDRVVMYPGSEPST